ncbi:condensation domain-containing protein, partial [Williamsia limnetica]|uniref:condensation domain-containing protein n=1 Tax=Williamsia limnetica TaxID=882452 RepID=UPI0011B49590
VVVAVEHAVAGTVLVAYLTPGSLEVSGEQLRVWLGARLPAHMVPTAFVWLEVLPVTANGKLDRKALPAADLTTVVGQGRTLSSDTEIQVAAAFSAVLGMDSGVELSVEDDFFALGGHSLLATRLVARLGEGRVGQLSLRSVFDHPTVAGLAAVVDGSVSGGPVLPRVGDVVRPEVVPASFGQRALWVVGELTGAGSVYTVPVVWQVRGDLDVAAWEQAVCDVVARHEALRTRLIEDASGELVQVVEPGENVTDWLVVDHRDASERDEEATGELLDDWVQRPVSLNADMPVRALVVSRSNGRYVLAMAIQHAFVDEWSQPALAADLWSAYVARGAGREPAFEPLHAQYADFAVWQHHLDDQGYFDVARRYWADELAGVPELSTLPADHVRPAFPSHRGADLPIAIGAEVTGRLQQVAADANVSMFMVVQAVVAATLHRLGAGEDLVVGSPIGGRTDPSLVDTVGYFVNTLPIRHRLSVDDSVGSLLSRTRTAVLDAFEHQHLPFDLMAAEAEVLRVPGANPLAQVLLTYTTDIGESSISPELAISSGLTILDPVRPHLGAVKADLDVYLGVRDGGLEGFVSYATDLYDPATAAQFVSTLGAVAEAFAGSVDVRLAELEVPAPEREVLAGWSQGAVADLSGSTVDGVLRAAATENADVGAVVFGDVCLSYAEFDGRVNRLARCLVGCGVGVGDRVVVVVRRDEWLPVMVGIAPTLVDI